MQDSHECLFSSHIFLGVTVVDAKTRHWAEQQTKMVAIDITRLCGWVSMSGSMLFHAGHVVQNGRSVLSIDSLEWFHKGEE